MPPSDIVLDRASFKALASDTRITILKLLSQRKHTLTELSSNLGMSHPSVKEHLESLARAGLVERFDEGRKWKYYGLTRKGRGVLFPEEKKILVLLVLTLFSAGGFVVRWFSKASFGTASFSQKIAADSTRELPEKPLELFEESVPVATSIIPEAQTMGSTTDWVLIILGALLAISMISLFYYWLRRRVSKTMPSRSKR